MKTLIIIITSILLVSCSKREDYFFNSNKPAEADLTLLNTHSSSSATINGNSITDTLKYGYYYRFTLNLTDEKEVVNLTYSSNDGVLYMDGLPFSSQDVVIGEHLFEWMPDSTGSANFDLTIKDGYDSLTVKTFNIHVFDNYTPSVTWALTESQAGGLTKKIIVYGEDGDQLYGGNIIGYEYVINGNSTIYSDNEFLYTFPSTGTYSISVRAKDNNNEWGNYYTIDNYVIL